MKSLLDAAGGDTGFIVCDCDKVAVADGNSFIRFFAGFKELNFIYFLLEFTIKERTTLKNKTSKPIFASFMLFERKKEKFLKIRKSQKKKLFVYLHLLMTLL